MRRASLSDVHAEQLGDALGGLDAGAREDDDGGLLLLDLAAREEALVRGGGLRARRRRVEAEVGQAEKQEVEVEGVPRASKGKKMTTTKNKKKRKHGKNRSVSILIYLNNNAWDVKRDGGALRAYLPPAVVSDNYQPPALGLLGTARDGPSESKVRVVESRDREAGREHFDVRGRGDAVAAAMPPAEVGNDRTMEVSKVSDEGPPPYKKE